MSEYVIDPVMRTFQHRARDYVVQGLRAQGSGLLLSAQGFALCSFIVKVHGLSRKAAVDQQRGLHKLAVVGIEHLLVRSHFAVCLLGGKPKATP